MGAELLSEALGDVPQAAELTISFRLYQPQLERNWHQKPYPVLAARRSGPTTHFHLMWSITVQSVPSDAKHVIKELLVAEGFARVKRWFQASANRTQTSASLTVMFDETEKQLAYHDEVR